MKRKLKLRELKWFVQGYITTYWQIQGENSYPLMLLTLNISLVLLCYIQGYFSLFTFCSLFENILNIYFLRKRRKKREVEVEGEIESGRRGKREREEKESPALGHTLRQDSPGPPTVSVEGLTIPLTCVDFFFKEKFLWRKRGWENCQK